jgi:hypothetical protein
VFVTKWTESRGELLWFRISNLVEYMNTTGYYRIKVQGLGRGHTVLFNDITEDGRAWISDPHVPSFLLIVLFHKTTLPIQIYYIRKYVTEYNFQKTFFFAYKV